MSIGEEALVLLLEGTANMLRGMCMDPSIPKRAKEAMQCRIAEIDECTETWNDAQYAGQPIVTEGEQRSEREG